MVVSNNTHTVVVGLGATGRSAAHHLALHNIPFVIVDSRMLPPALAKIRAEIPEISVYAGGFYPKILKDAIELVISPGVALKEPAIAEAIAQGVPAYGDIELFARVARSPVVAITGTNGKSTVTALVGAMVAQAGLQVAVGGNFGPPALELLPRPSWIPDGTCEEPDIYVLELSSFQLETSCSLEPTVAVLLNLSADHLDRYTDFGEYVEAKKRVFRGARRAVLNRADDGVMKAFESLVRKPDVVTFGTGLPGAGDFGIATRDGESWLCRGREGTEKPEYLLSVEAVPLVGAHNVTNVLAALAAAQALGLPVGPCVEAVRGFQAMGHRCELVLRGAGLTWVNDSKGTNVGATAAAVMGMSSVGPVVLIAGGDGKGADFRPLVTVLEGRVRVLILLGRDAQLIGRAVAGLVPCHYANTMAEAVEAAFSLSEPGDVVLLSPACASWDMYPNYQIRGRDFSVLAKKLVARETLG